MVSTILLLKPWSLAYVQGMLISHVDIAHLVHYRPIVAHFMDTILLVYAQCFYVFVFRKNFTAKLDGPAATFNFEVWVYGNDTVIQNSDSEESYQVYNGTVKFAFSIDNWKFCGSNDTDCLNHDGSDLEYGYYLDVYATYSAANKDEIPKGGLNVRGRSEIPHRRPITYNYGGGDVTSSQMVCSFFVFL